jgi:hypothetical protein
MYESVAMYLCSIHRSGEQRNSRGLKRSRFSGEIRRNETIYGAPQQHEVAVEKQKQMTSVTVSLEGMKRGSVQSQSQVGSQRSRARDMWSSEEHRRLIEGMSLYDQD